MITKEEVLFDTYNLIQQYGELEDVMGLLSEDQTEVWSVFDDQFLVYFTDGVLSDIIKETKH
jgi:hypothetical protein